MAVPVIRVAPPTSTSGMQNTIGGENIGAGPANFLRFTSAIGGYIFQTTGPSHSGVGLSQSVSIANDVKRGPHHASAICMTVYPLAGGNAWSFFMGATSRRWYLGTSADYKAGWQQAIVDPTSPPDVGTAYSIGNNTTNMGMMFDATAGGEDMFEAFASAISWVGKHIEVDGGTSGDPIDLAGISLTDRVVSPRTTAAPFKGNYYGHAVDLGSNNIRLGGPILIGHANGTTVTYFKDTSLSISCAAFPVNDKWFYLESQGNTTMIFGDSAVPTPGTIAGTATKKLRLDTATDEPAGGFQSWYRTWINGRAWEIGSNSEFHNGGLNNVSDVAMHASAQMLEMVILQTRLDYAAPPGTGRLTGCTFGDPTTYCLTVSTHAATMYIDYDFAASAKGAGKAIQFTHPSGDIALSFAPGISLTAADITVSGGGTVSIPASGSALTIDGIISGATMIIYDLDAVDPQELGTELQRNNNAGTSELYSYGGAKVGDDIILVMLAPGYRPIQQVYTLGANSTTFTLQTELESN